MMNTFLEFFQEFCKDAERVCLASLEDAGFHDARSAKKARQGIKEKKERERFRDDYMNSNYAK